MNISHRQAYLRRQFRPAKQVRCAWKWALALMAFFCFADAPRAVPAVAEPLSPFTQYEKFTSLFWNTEKKLQQQNSSSFERFSYTSPLPPADPLYQKYFSVHQSVGEYLQQLEARGISESWTIPTSLYLGGIAAFTIGDYNVAQKYFSRLLKEYPDYKRDLYISDRYAPDPAFSQPVKPALTKLLFYCQIITASNPDQNPFTAFQQFNQSALKVLSTQKSYAYSLSHHPNIHYRREFYLDEDYGGTLDQTRATALPRTP